jgi:putative membrane protein
VRYVVLMLKGMAFGLSNIVPGLTGAVVLMILGVYEQFVDAVGNFMVNRGRWKEYLSFLGFLGLGAVIAVVAFAGALSWLLDRYPAPMMFLFMGLVVGTIPSVVRYHRDMRPSIGRVVALLGGLALVVAMSILERQGMGASVATSPRSLGGALYLVAAGFFAGAGNVTPGISGSYVFLLAGIYRPVMAALSALKDLSIHWSILAPTGTGVVLGIVLFSKLIHTALRRAPAVTYYAILGMLAGSVYGLWPEGWTAVNPLALLLPFVAGVALPVLLSKGAGSEAERPTTG